MLTRIRNAQQRQRPRLAFIHVYAAGRKLGTEEKR
jgi:hypothetical protein